MMLQDILTTKRIEVGERQSRLKHADIRDRALRAPAARTVEFTRPISLIGEVKRRSPSKGELSRDLDPVAQARAYERGGASVISVLTDEQYFGGGFADLQSVRDAVDVPVLCKDFVLTRYQVDEARAHGADLVLLIVAALEDDELRDLKAYVEDLDMTALVEVHDQHDLARALAADAEVIGINNRDLKDFSVNLLTTAYLAPLIPDECIIVSESGIETRQDVHTVRDAGASVVLVGEALVRSEDPEATVRDLLA